jgi:hypothetical protein
VTSNETMTIAALVAECDRLAGIAAQRRMVLNNRIQALRVIPRPLPCEREELKRSENEMGAIGEQVATLRARKRELLDLRDESYERLFIDAARELLPPDVRARIHERTMELQSQRQERRSALGVGSAIPVLGTAPGMRRRA